MLEEIRDSLYTTAWFGLMTAVWFGWAQEEPPARGRTALIVGAVLGLAIAVGFGVLTALHWPEPTALTGRYGLFGIVVAAEVLLAGGGAAGFLLTGHGRWVAWWVALVVAVHFISLAWIFSGPSLVWLGIVEVVALAVVAVLVRSSTYPTSRWVGPVMGLTILAFAVVNGVAVLQRMASA